MKERIQELLDNVEPHHVTPTGWSHYKCPFCSDTGAHLGINTQTGAVLCLRCGFKCSIAKKASVAVRRFLEEQTFDAFISPFRGMLVDSAIDTYMENRGILSQCGWAYGRGKFAGRVALPSYDKLGRITYCQWRRVDGGTDLRYVSLPGTTPALDFWPYKFFGRGMLILTEGPIDAYKVRDSFKLWASATYGTTPKPSLFDDVRRAYETDMCDSVVFLFDNDEAGHNALDTNIRLLKYSYSVDRVAGVCMQGTKDPADANSAQLIQAITTAIERL